MIEPDHYTRRAIQDMWRFTWKKTWPLWPRQCRMTRKWLWPFTSCYRGVRVIHGPGDALILRRWISPEAYTFEAIKGNIQ